MKVKITTQQQKEVPVLQLQNVQLIGGEHEDFSSIPMISLLDDEYLFPQDQTDDVSKEINNNCNETENNSNTENKIVPYGVTITEIKEEVIDADQENKTNNNSAVINGVTIKEEPEDTYENITTNNTNIVNNNIYVNLHTANTKSETFYTDGLITATNATDIPKLIEYYNGINRISIVIVQIINENINSNSSIDTSNIAEKKIAYEARKKLLFDSVKDSVKTYLIPQSNDPKFLNKLLEKTREQAKSNLNITETIFNSFVKELINYVNAPDLQSNIILNSSSSHNNGSISYQSVTMSAKNQSVFQPMPFRPNYTTNTNAPQVSNYGNENYLFQTGNSSWSTAPNYTNYNNGNILNQGTNTLPSFNQSLNPHAPVMQPWNNIPEQRNTFNNYNNHNNQEIADGGFTRIGYNSWPVEHNNQFRTSERALRRFEPYSIGQTSIQRTCDHYNTLGKSFDNNINNTSTNVFQGTTYDHCSGGSFYTPPPTYGQSVNTSLRAITSGRGAKSTLGVDRRRRSNLPQLPSNGQVNAAVSSRSSAKADALSVYCGRYPQLKANSPQKCCMCNKKAASMCGMCQKTFFCSENCKIQSVMFKVACTRVHKVL